MATYQKVDEKIDSYVSFKKYIEFLYSTVGVLRFYFFASPTPRTMFSTKFA